MPATMKTGSAGIVRCSVCAGHRSTVLPFHLLRRNVDPHPPHGQAPVSPARIWDPSRNISDQKPILKISLGPVAIVLAAGCTPWPFLSDPRARRGPPYE